MQPDYIIEVNGVEGQWVNGEWAKLVKDKTVKKLQEIGYRVVTRKYCLISRIDKRDWLQIILNDDLLADDSANWKDYYRRNYSKDLICVPESVARKILNSSGENVGYVEK